MNITCFSPLPKCDSSWLTRPLTSPNPAVSAPIVATPASSAACDVGPTAKSQFKGALQLLIHRYKKLRFAQVPERASTKSFVVLITGNSKSNHIGAQGTLFPTRPPPPKPQKTARSGSHRHETHYHYSAPIVATPASSAAQAQLSHFQTQNYHTLLYLTFILILTMVK